MKCKFGLWLGEKADDPSISASTVAQEAPVSATTIKVHRSKMCGCFSVLDVVAPGGTDVALTGLPKPSLDYSEAGGVLVSKPRPADSTASERELFEEYDLDPDDWQIVSIGKSKRQANSGEWFESCRATFKPRKTAEIEGLTFEQIEEIVKSVPTPEPRVKAGSAYVVPVGDLQAGKVDGGGTAALIERFTGLLLASRDAYLEDGRAGTVVMPWLGDCNEGYTSQGGRLATRQDIWLSEQVRLVQRMILLGVELFSPITERLIIPVVPGNHGEATRQFSTVGTDSWDVHAAASVADTVSTVSAACGNLGNVEFVFPQRDKLTVTLDVAGTRITCMHGHQFRGGLNGAEKWAAGHALGRQAEGTADLYLCGHLHHFEIRTVGQGQTIIQIDALDGGSQWFANRTGSNQPAGLCSLVVDNGRWSNLRRYYSEGQSA